MSSPYPENEAQEPRSREPLSRWQGVRYVAVKQLRRFGSPSCLLVALILFPLPWVEIQCIARKKPAPATTFLTESGVDEEMAERLVPWEQEAETWFTQSGLQAARGTFTSHTKMSDPEAIRQLADQVAWSPLMVFFPMVLVVGIAAGLLPAESHRWRRKLLLGCILTALALLLVQSLAGFPLENGFAEVIRRDAVERKRPPPLPKDAAYATRYTIGLDLTIVSLGAALAPFVADWYGKRRQRFVYRSGAQS